MVDEAMIDETTEPRTIASLLADLKTLGILEGMTVIVHSSLSSIGWVCGGETAVIHALLAAVGNSGTLVMPAHSGDYSEPANWSSPPVPESWWQVIRDHMPAFDPDKTPSARVGRIAESFRTWPGTQRSMHPQVSFCAAGPNAGRIVQNHPLEESLGEASPLGELYRIGGYVLLLGVGHESNTSLHLAESIARVRSWKREGAAISRNGKREWIAYDDVDYDASEFPAIGSAFESACPDALKQATVGSAASKLFPVKALVEFGVHWFESQGHIQP